MASNIVTAGLGHRLLSGGLGGNGLITGSVELVQNPSFETAGSLPGDAASWNVTIVNSAEAFCAFTRPGLSVVTDTVPVTLGDPGVVITENIDGTISLIEGSGVQAAQEDFEEGWLNNDQYLFVFPQTAFTNCYFDIGVKPIEDFEAGWLNDPGELVSFDEIASAIASFSFHIDPSTLAVLNEEFESFEGRWPVTAPGLFISQIPEIIFGTAKYGNWKTNVFAATTINGVFTTAFANGQVIDGHTIVTGERLLIKNQNDTTQNGIYIANASGAPTRSTDADDPSEFFLASVIVVHGTVNAATSWQCESTVTTVGLSLIVFAQITDQVTPYAQNPQGIITAGDANGELQYADALLITTTSEIIDDLTITITYLDKIDGIQTAIRTIPENTPIGTTFGGLTTLGVRAVTSVVATTVMPGLIFHGEPGFLLDSNQQLVTAWERAEFPIPYGAENFELGWSDNEHYIAEGIEITPVAYAGFNWIDCGSYDLGSHVYTGVGPSFALPDYGKELVLTVQALTGFSLADNNLSIIYLNQINAIATTTAGPVRSGLPANTSISVELALGDIGLTEVSSVTSSTAQTGILEFRAPLDVGEIFDNLLWPAPDPGL